MNANIPANFTDLTEGRDILIRGTAKYHRADNPVVSFQTTRKALVRCHGDEDTTITVILSESGVNEQTRREFGLDQLQEAIDFAAAYIEDTDAVNREQAQCYLANMTSIAQERGYQRGWVWYRMRDAYGAELASELMPRE